MTSKAELRLAWRRDYPRDETLRREISRQVVTHLLQSAVFNAAEKVALFLPLPWEPDISAVWAARPESYFFPRVLVSPPTLTFYSVTSLDSLTPGYAGLSEPIADEKKRAPRWNERDLILVPGYAFDQAGARVGSGKGYYDRFLAAIPSQKWGVCFAAQISKERLAQEPTDVRMDGLCSERGVEMVRNG